MQGVFQTPNERELANRSPIGWTALGAGTLPLAGMRAPKVLPRDTANCWALGLRVLFDSRRPRNK